ncbi:hypothetical protein [Pyxidicoccus xibeiensis]|uniref:hypothetical protein n=1 Tax=Pyxidicoccus xibeiensis TaxID=2906759 RepID=UPI0020A7644F|nr:hypothetical protein [Pyxidicoccus xibeiensis]MCP3137064.1 hypothetical protein [Pyxidicoccus xibeiensis]
MNQPSMRGAVCAATFLAPLAAGAEVMDKETPPWEPLPMLGTLGVVALCFFLGRSPRRIWLLPALLVAAFWAFVRFNDDFYSSDVGPAIRTELPEAAVAAYEWLLPVQALLPTAAILLGLARRRAGLRGARQASA